MDLLSIKMNITDFRTWASPSQMEYIQVHKHVRVPGTEQPRGGDRLGPPEVAAVSSARERPSNFAASQAWEPARVRARLYGPTHQMHGTGTDVGKGGACVP